MGLKKELDKFWNWFGMNSNEYAFSSSNGERESNYPLLNELRKCAENNIQELNINYDSELAELLIQALAIDSEDELVLEYIKDDLAPIKRFCIQAINSNQHHARWQIAELLGHKNPDISKDILIQMIKTDKDIYVKRRALLSLSKVDLERAKIEAQQFLNSSDDIFKRIAHEIQNN